MHSTPPDENLTDIAVERIPMLVSLETDCRRPGRGGLSAVVFLPPWEGWTVSRRLSPSLGGVDCQPSILGEGEGRDGQSAVIFLPQTWEDGLSAVGLGVGGGGGEGWTVNRYLSPPDLGGWTVSRRSGGGGGRGEGWTVSRYLSPPDLGGWTVNRRLSSPV